MNWELKEMPEGQLVLKPDLAPYIASLKPLISSDWAGAGSFKGVMWRGALDWSLLRHQGSPGSIPGPPPAKESLAPSLPGGATYSTFHSLCWAPAVGPALGEVRPGWHPASWPQIDADSPLSCQACGCLFPAGQTPWNLISAVRATTHTKNSLPMRCLFICLFNKYLSTGCARHCWLPGDEAVQTSGPVYVLLEPSQAEEFTLLFFVFFFF